MKDLLQINDDPAPRNQIKGFIHCATCLDEKPDDFSAKEYSSLELGWTEDDRIQYEKAVVIHQV